jgi:hypothetical protein
MKWAYRDRALGHIPDEFEGSRFIHKALRGPFFTGIDVVDVIEWPHSDGLSEGRLGERPYGL